VRDLFLLRDGVVFLNHGVFGACPRSVFEEYQRWQLELERQPVEFLAREFHGRMRGAREALSGFVGAEADDLVFVTNATTGVNIVARSLPLGPGDEVLLTDHEYGAIDRTWRFVCADRGATLVADYYAANCNKWLCAPKGSGFLYARREMQDRLRPLLVSWGDESSDGLTPSAFINEFESQGTRDPAAFLAVPAAIAFQRAHDWDAVQESCHALAQRARAAVTALTGLPPLSPDDRSWYVQMVSLPLPVEDAAAAKRRLLEEFRIDVVVTRWQGHTLLRVSVQAYNTRDDLDRLGAAVEALLA